MRPRPLGYVFLKPTHIRSFDFSLNSQVASTGHKRHYSALKQEVELEEDNAKKIFRL